MRTNRVEVVCRDQKNDYTGFAVVLFTVMRDFLEAIRATFALRRARRHTGFDLGENEPQSPIDTDGRGI